MQVSRRRFFRALVAGSEFSLHQAADTARQDMIIRSARPDFETCWRRSLPGSRRLSIFFVRSHVAAHVGRGDLAA
jgi:hypothetical protein